MIHFLDRRTVADTFWNAETESELRENGWIDRLFKDVHARELIMEEINRLRATSIYPHRKCSKECKERGILYDAAVKVHNPARFWDKRLS